MKHFISVTDLAAKLTDKSVVVFDCRFKLDDPACGLQQYRAGHIPGAFYLDLNKDLAAPVQAHGGRHPLPDIDAFTRRMRAAGANAQSTIVLYDDSRFAYAARAWWLLRYFGHTQVLILDGGFSGWKESGGALDRREPSPRLGNFTAVPTDDMMLHREQILQQTGSLTLIDSRDSKRFSGEEEPIDPVAGHIPGALNFFWQDASDAQGYIKDEAAQRARWQSLPTNENLVVYCGSGVTACVNLLSLDLAGVPAKLYPGSWSDWCSYPDAQVASLGAQD